MERLAVVMPSFSANSAERIFLLASMTSKLMIIGIIKMLNRFLLLSVLR